MSVMVAILVVVVIAVLVMFGQGLRDVAQNSGLKNMLSEDTLASKTGYERFDRTQENIAVSGVQGITAKFDPEHPEEWINYTFATLLNKDPKELEDKDLEALARALAMMEKANNPKKIENLNENYNKCENLGIENDGSLGKVSYKYPIQDGIKKELNYKYITDKETKVVNQFLHDTPFEKTGK